MTAHETFQASESFCNLKSIDLVRVTKERLFCLDYCLEISFHSLSQFKQFQTKTIEHEEEIKKNQLFVIF